MKLGLCQMPVTASQQENHAAMRRYVRDAAAAGCNLVVLPEMWCCPYDNAAFTDYAEPQGGQTWQLLRDTARECCVWLVAGSVPERDGDAIYNTCYVFDETGREIARHRKIHLFDVDIKGGVRFKESHSFAPGEDITVFDTRFGRMGVEICFDIRFPELTTGPRHWELSVRARAMDNELFFVGASAARYNGFDYECWGHSTVADPFGMVRAACDETEQILYCNIDLNEVDSVREQLPTFLHLREDVYNVAK